MDDTTDDRPTARWRPVGDGAEAPEVRFPAPRERRMSNQQAVPADDQPTMLQPAATPPEDPDEQATRLMDAVPGPVQEPSSEPAREQPAGHAAQDDPEPTREPEAAAPAEQGQAPATVTHQGPIVLHAGGATAAPAEPVAAPDEQAVPDEQVVVGQPARQDAHEVPEVPAGALDDEPTTTVAVPEEAPTQVRPVAAADGDDPVEPLHPAMVTAEVGEHYDGLPSPEVSAGDVFAGRYRLEQQLAQRGGTLTWRAFDQKLSRSVLVHILGHDDPRTADVLEAARKAAFATDSRFLRVLDAVAGEEPGAPSVVVCEFAPGESLERLLQQGPLSALEAAWVARELADALGVMHAEGLFHQRINPDTVVITATGNVKIVGFLIEAAMYPDAADGTLAWSERESADVQALGKVLYASLVTRWPTAREQMLDEQGNPRVTWGMPAAPMDGRGWLTPRQIRSGVSPALDVICDQILSDAPRHNEAPLRTANQVALALNKVLGTADAAADLERRMRYPVVPVQQEPTIRRPRSEPSGLDTTETMAAIVDEPAPRPAAQAGTAGSVGSAPATGGASAPDHDTSAAPKDRAAAASLRQGGPNRPRPRRWLALLVGLFCLVMVIGLVRHFTQHSSTSATGSTDSGSHTVAIAAIDDFDPATDGGNGEENPSQVKLADDGNTSTAWQTVTYLGDPALGKLKPGVGLVLDLGSEQSVSAVKLTLQGQPTSVELLVPASTATTQAPMGSIKQWREVASNASAGTTVTLTPSSGVKSRYLLVYLTKLPKLEGTKYRGDIAEVSVES